MQTLWDKLRAQVHALALSVPVGLVKLVFMFGSVHIIVEEGTVEVCNIFMGQVDATAECEASIVQAIEVAGKEKENEKVCACVYIYI